MFSGGENDIAAPAIALFSEFANSQLKEFLEDDAKLDTFLKDQKQNGELEVLLREKDLQQATSRSLADYNLSFEAKLEEGKRRLQETCKEGNLLLAKLSESVAQLQNKNDFSDAETVLGLLQTSAAEMEEESEKIAERFLEGDMDIDTFLDQFQGTRKIMHLRKVKAEKMADLLKKKTSSFQYPSFPTGGVPYYPPAPPVGGAPYPTGPLNMPLPGGYPVPRY